MDVVDEIYKRRAELESNMEKLEKALRHWQTWDAEYEGLKEELIELNDNASIDELRQIADNFGGELVTLKDIEELSGLDKGMTKPLGYITSLIEKRQDYVSQNILTVSKQLDAARLALISMEESSESDMKSDRRLAVSEIIEELDDDDNVISSRVIKPEEATANILETLQKAGIAETGNLMRDSPASGSDATTKDNGVETDSPKPHVSSSPTPDTHDISKDQTSTERTVASALLKGTFGENDRVIELDDEDKFLAATAVVPQDESPEDAQLRREMLNYHLNEVGNVVAEMDILEGESDDDDFYDELQDLRDDDDMSEVSDISEEEDEHGRSLRSGVTNDYRKQMRELEQRLRIKNLGPEPENVDAIIAAPTHSAPQQQSNLPSALSDKRLKKKKSVRFAKEVDVSPAPQPAPQPAPKATKTAASSRSVKTLADTVTERKGQANADVPTTKPAKVSRFKQARSDAPISAPAPTTEASPPPTLLDAVVERPAATEVAPPSAPDDLDPQVQRLQLAAEYYRLRNNIVQQQGGFKVTEEDKDQPLMEEYEDGQVKKVSRFRAARLQR